MKAVLKSIINSRDQVTFPNDINQKIQNAKS